jgi:hypothetical protein
MTVESFELPSIDSEVSFVLVMRCYATVVERDDLITKLQKNRKGNFSQSGQKSVVFSQF